VVAWLPSSVLLSGRECFSGRVVCGQWSSTAPPGSCKQVCTVCIPCSHMCLFQASSQGLLLGLIHDEDELLRSEFLPSVLLPSESLLWCCIRWCQSWTMHRLWSGLCSFTVPVDLSPLGLTEDYLWAAFFFRNSNR
jgi:hypothetical protein